MRSPAAASFERFAPAALFAVIAVAALLAGRYFWWVLLAGVAAVYLAITVVRWSIGARAVLGALLVAPLATAVPVVGASYLVFPAAALLAVGFLGVTMERKLAGLPILAFLAWQLAGASWVYLGVGRELGWFLLVAPAAMLGAYLVMQSGLARLSRFFVAGIVVVSVLEAVLGLSQSLFGVPDFTAVGAPVFIEARNYFAYLVPGVSPVARLATGTFEHFNGLGALLGMGTCICFWYWMRRRSLPRSIPLAVVAAGLVATFSRGSLIGAICGCALIVVMLAKRGHRFGTWVAIACAVLVFVAALQDEIVLYATRTAELAPRVAVWGGALAEYGRDPVAVVFGRGFGFYQLALTQSQAATQRLHSAPLQLLLESGIFGTALFVYALVYAFRRRRTDWGGMSVPAAAAVVGFLVTCIFDNSLAGVLGAFWFALLTVLALDRVPDEAKVASPRPAGPDGPDASGSVAQDRGGGHAPPR